MCPKERKRMSGINCYTVTEKEPVELQSDVGLNYRIVGGVLLKGDAADLMVEISNKKKLCVHKFKDSNPQTWNAKLDYCLEECEPVTLTVVGKGTVSVTVEQVDALDDNDLICGCGDSDCDECEAMTELMEQNAGSCEEGEEDTEVPQSSSDEEDDEPKIEEVTSDTEEEKPTPVKPAAVKIAQDVAKKVVPFGSQVSSKKLEAKLKQKPDTQKKDDKSCLAGKKRPAESAEGGSATKQQKLTDDKGLNKKVRQPNGLSYEILRVGTGTKLASPGKKVTIKYAGRLASNGKQFDSGSLPFRVGSGDVIAGFDQGVQKMLIGEKRRVFIPAKLGYGKSKVQGIPANSDLIFDIELTQCS